MLDRIRPTAAEALAEPAPLGIEAQALACLHRVGLKPTFARLTVLQLLLQAQQPVRFADMQRQLSESSHALSVNTAYMSLRQLEDKALVHRLRLDGHSGTFYALSDAQSPSISLTCLSCGKQEWISNPQVVQAMEAACTQQGAQALRFRLDVKVRCQHCTLRGR